jgi:hypothetical protein
VLRVEGMRAFFVLALLVSCGPAAELAVDAGSRPDAGTSSGGGASASGGGTALGGGAGSTGGGAGITCDRVAVQVATGGCALSLVAPSNCANVTFTTTGFIELDWSTSTTFCEGPHHLLITGNPPSATVYVDLQLTSGSYSNYAMTRNIGGYYLLQASEIAHLPTTNGQYFWRVVSFYGSVSEAATFVVK